jgi:hypothetical protein
MQAIVNRYPKIRTTLQIETNFVFRKLQLTERNMIVLGLFGGG